MPHPPLTNWSLFRILCRVLGDQDRLALVDSVAAGLLPQLVEMAQRHDVLPALAMRCSEDFSGSEVWETPTGAQLTQALRDNTFRNMQITTQALKLARLLNAAGITPLFLKGTVQLLATNTKNLGFRKQLDIDLLVEPAQLEAAAEAILADGYRFCKISDFTLLPTTLRESRATISRGTVHHHLPELMKDDSVALVELHRHFLPKQLQRGNPLEPLFSTAVPQEIHRAYFLVPSAEYQLIHLVLGKMVHDGHLARRSFPLREACDYIHILEAATDSFDHQLVAQHCCRRGELFSRLVGELMAYTPATTVYKDITEKELEKYLCVIQKRFSSDTMRKLLDAYARTLHLANSIIHSPAKLPAYLSRIG